MDKFYRALDWAVDHKWIVAGVVAVLFLLAIFFGGDAPDFTRRV